MTHPLGEVCAQVNDGKNCKKGRLELTRNQYDTENINFVENGLS
jgi:hypothetical protein